MPKYINSKSDLEECLKIELGGLGGGIAVRTYHNFGTSVEV